VRSKFSCVRSSHDLCNVYARTRAHLRGNIGLGVALVFFKPMKRTDLI